MARELRLQIQGDSKSGQRALDDVADESDKAALTLKALGREMKAAAREGGHLEGELKDVSGAAKTADANLAALAREADKAGDQLRQAGNATAKLDLQLEAARVELGRLQKQFGDTGDAALVKDLEKQYSSLNKLSRLRAKLSQDEDTARTRAEATAAAIAKETKAVEQLGDRAGGTAKQVDFITRAGERLDAELESTKQHIQRLMHEFAQTGDLKTLELVEKQRSEYEKIENTKKRIIERDKSDRKRAAKDAEKLGDIARREARGPLGKIFGFFTDAADKAGTAVSKGFSELASDISPSGVAKVAIGVAAAPAVGTIAGGATLAGGAALGVGLGIGGAVAGNPELFQKKWSTAVEAVKTRWILASDGFTTPTLHAIDILKGAIDNIPLEKILSSASKYVEPLARGVSGFLKPLGAGIAILVDKAGPVVDVLERDLPILGRAFKQAFSDIGDGADGSAAALDALVKGIAAIVVATGNFIRIASDGYGWLVKYADFFGVSDKPVMTYGRALDGATESTDTFGESAKEAASHMKDLLDEWDKYAGIAVDSTEAAIALEQAQDKLVDGWKKGSNALDISTQKGRDNVNLALDYVKAAQQQRDAAIAAGGGTVQAQAEANAAYEKTLGSLEDILVQMGLSREAAHAFVEQYDGRTVTMNLKVNGTVHWNDDVGISVGNLLHHARGGETLAGPIMVGEHGPEIRWASRGQYLSTAEETRKMTSMMGGTGAGSGALRIDFSGVGSGNWLAQAFMAEIQRGGIQVYAGGAQVSSRPSS
jgi:CRISPR/Cas system-associated protein endoribonuclease Cas2